MRIRRWTMSTRHSQQRSAMCEHIPMNRGTVIDRLQKRTTLLLTNDCVVLAMATIDGFKAFDIIRHSSLMSRQRAHSFPRTTIFRAEPRDWCSFRGICMYRGSNRTAEFEEVDAFLFKQFSSQKMTLKLLTKTPNKLTDLL